MELCLYGINPSINGVYFLSLMYDLCFISATDIWCAILYHKYHMLTKLALSTWQYDKWCPSKVSLTLLSLKFFFMGLCVVFNSHTFVQHMISFHFCIPTFSDISFIFCTLRYTYDDNILHLVLSSLVILTKREVICQVKIEVKILNRTF